MIQPQAILFPGQGAQFPGMGRDFAERFPEARATFEEADRALGCALSDACWNRGEEVHRTDVADCVPHAADRRFDDELLADAGHDVLLAQRRQTASTLLPSGSSRNAA